MYFKTALLAPDSTDFSSSTKTNGGTQLSINRVTKPLTYIPLTEQQQDKDNGEYTRRRRNRWPGGDSLEQ
jgi:hypothetical protein